MSKFFIRIVALLLVSCLVADPTLAAAFHNPLLPIQNRPVEAASGAASSRLDEEALAGLSVFMQALWSGGIRHVRHLIVGEERLVRHSTDSDAMTVVEVTDRSYGRRSLSPILDLANRISDPGAWIAGLGGAQRWTRSAGQTIQKLFAKYSSGRKKNPSSAGSGRRISTDASNSRTTLEDEAWARAFRRKILDSSYNNRPIVEAHWNDIVRSLGGIAVLKTFEYRSPVDFAALLAKFYESKAILEEKFGRDSVPELFDGLLPLNTTEDRHNPFLTSYALYLINQLATSKTVSPEELLNAVLSAPAVPFIKAYVYLKLRDGWRRFDGGADLTQPDMECLKKEMLTYLNHFGSFTLGQTLLGDLLAGDAEIAERLADDALTKRDSGAVRMIVTSPGLTQRLWKAILRRNRNTYRQAIINAFLENAYIDIINEQAYLMSDEAPVGRFGRPREKGEKRILSESVIREFLKASRVSLPARLGVAVYLLPDFFRLTIDGQVVTPIYMMTRGYRGGEFQDVDDPRDIAMNLVPYGFTIGGMTRDFIGDPAIHELDLALLAHRAGQADVWKILDPMHDAHYTFIAYPTVQEVTREDYVGSYRVNPENYLATHKRLSQLHYMERWYKQLLFDGLDALQKSSNVEAADDALRRIEGSVVALKELYSSPARSRPTHYDLYGNLNAAALADARALAAHGKAAEAYEEIMRSETMHVLSLERRTMAGHYEDYRLTVPPPRGPNQEPLNDIDLFREQVSDARSSQSSDGRELTHSDTYKAWVIYATGGKENLREWLRLSGRDPARQFLMFRDALRELNEKYPWLQLNPTDIKGQLEAKAKESEEAKQLLASIQKGFAPGFEQGHFWTLREAIRFARSHGQDKFTGARVAAAKGIVLSTWIGAALGFGLLVYLGVAADLVALSHTAGNVHSMLASPLLRILVILAPILADLAGARWIKRGIIRSSGRLLGIVAHKVWNTHAFGTPAVLTAGGEKEESVHEKIRAAGFSGIDQVLMMARAPLNRIKVVRYEQPLFRDALGLTIQEAGGIPTVVTFPSLGPGTYPVKEFSVIPYHRMDFQFLEQAQKMDTMKEKAQELLQDPEIAALAGRESGTRNPQAGLDKTEGSVTAMTDQYEPDRKAIQIFYPRVEELGQRATPGVTLHLERVPAAAGLDPGASALHIFSSANHVTSGVPLAAKQLGARIIMADAPRQQEQRILLNRLDRTFRNRVKIT